MSKKFFRNTKYSKLNTKFRKLILKKFTDPTTSIDIYQYNTDKQSLEKKFRDVDKKCQTLGV